MALRGLQRGGGRFWRPPAGCVRDAIVVQVEAYVGRRVSTSGVVEQQTNVDGSRYYALTDRAQNLARSSRRGASIGYTLLLLSCSTRSKESNRCWLRAESTRCFC